MGRRLLSDEEANLAKLSSHSHELVFSSCLWVMLGSTLDTWCLCAVLPAAAPTSC